MQRLIEVIRSFPELPLWMALSAVLPVNWSPILIFFGITVILAMLDWTGLARAVRSKLLSLREEDYCAAAELMGASPRRIIGRHLLPGFMSHLIASATLSVPAMILGETALSFLGLGLAAAGDQLGRAAQRGAEYQRGGAVSLAAVSGGAGHTGHSDLQFLRRRPARRRRSVQVTSMPVGPSAARAACPACGKNQRGGSCADPVRRNRGWPVSSSNFTAAGATGRAENADFGLVECRDCGLVFQDPVLDDEGMAALYDRLGRPGPESR